MSALHTQGLLKIAGRDTRSLPHTLVSARTLLFRVYSEAFGDNEQEQANARRLVACWNACNGVSTEDIELDNMLFVAKLKENSTLKAQRDDLMTALNATLQWIDDNCETTGFEEIEAQADAAILNVTGGPTSEREAVSAITVPRDLLERASASIGAFCSDEGWQSSDMDTLDDLLAVLAQAPKPTTLTIPTTSVLIGQILVMADLLKTAIGVVRTVTGDTTEESDLLQTLIDQSEAAIATVLTEHAMPHHNTTPTQPTEHLMSTFPQTTQITPPAIGTPWPSQGGTYIGTMRGRDGQPDYHLVAAIGAHELDDQEWGSYGKRIEGADSYHDGRANTAAMASAGLDLALRIQALQIDGHADFYLPSQAEAHLLAANAKELMKPKAYWTSTQYSAHLAWCQYFYNGDQLNYHNHCEFRAVAVRSIQTVTP